MQQATVNLFADMGVQPGDAADRPRRRDRLDRHDGADLDDHRRRPRRDRASGGRRSRSPAPPPTRAAASSAASRCPPTAAPAGIRRPGRESWSYTWTPDRARGGHDLGAARPTTAATSAPRPPGDPVTVTARSCPCTLFGRHAIPADAATDDGSADRGRRAVPRGRGRRRSPALRFYKGAANTGTHVGHLWTAAGTLLGDAPRSPGRRRPAGSRRRFRRAGQRDRRTRPTSPPTSRRTAATLPTATSSATAVRRCAAARTGRRRQRRLPHGAGGFPTDTSEREQLLGDVVFVPAGQPADQAPPTITAVVPPDGSVGADPATKVSAAFDEALNASTVTQDTVQLRDPGRGTRTRQPSPTRRQRTPPRSHPPPAWPPPPATRRRSPPASRTWQATHSPRSAPGPSRRRARRVLRPGARSRARRLPAPARSAPLRSAWALGWAPGPLPRRSAGPIESRRASG